MRTGCYIHIPFCRKRCTYCDFNTYVGLLSLQDAYVNAVLQEISLRAERRPGIEVATLYFGGGTPSLLPAESIGKIIRRVRRHWALPLDAEITLEVNPGTVDSEKLHALRQVGVNRLSMGVQSSHSSELVLLGRIHTWTEAVEAFALARKAGFDNISIDLMYGLPGQPLQAWEETLERVLALEPDHLSLYALTLEPGTPLAEILALAAIPGPDPDLAADMYDTASQRLLVAGFWQYEISNWARSDRIAPELWAFPEKGIVESIRAKIGTTYSTAISQHNVIYWRNEAWLGIGAGAHSWFRGRRMSHHPHPQSYIHAVYAGNLHGIESEVIPPGLAQDESLMLGLRLVEGVSDMRFRELWGIGLADMYGSTIEKFISYGLLTWQKDCLRLTIQGRLLGNQIFQEFLR